MRQEERDENLSEPINQEEAMVTGGDQDLQENSETPRDRANRLRRECRASLSAAKKDAAAQLWHDHGSLRQEERDENLPEPLNYEESMVTGGDQDLQSNSNSLEEKERIGFDVSTGQVCLPQRKERRCGTISTGSIIHAGTGCWRLITRGRRHGHDDGVLGRSRQ